MKLKIDHKSYTGYLNFEGIELKVKKKEISYFLKWIQLTLIGCLKSEYAKDIKFTDGKLKGTFFGCWPVLTRKTGVIRIIYDVMVYEKYI